MIREINDSELSRQIQSFLQDQEFKVPNERTIKRILVKMPAATEKALSGINQVLDDSRKAFAKLLSFVEFLKNKNTIRENYSDMDLESLKKSIETALFYIKSYHAHNLSLHSNIRSHCVSLGFSDAKQANFQSECATIDDEEFHNEGCDHCDLIPKLFIVIEGQRKILKMWIFMRIYLT